LKIATTSLALVTVLAFTSLWGFIQERTPVDGIGVRWDLTAVQPNISSGMIEYIINKRGSDDVLFSSVVTKVEASFATWRNASPSVVDFVRLSDPSTSPIGTMPNRMDQTNVVFWEEDPRNTWMIPNFSSGYVIRRADALTGKLLDVDIVPCVPMMCETGPTLGISVQGWETLTDVPRERS